MYIVKIHKQKFSFWGLVRCYWAGQSNLRIQTVLCHEVFTCWLPILDLKTPVFLKEFLESQKVRRDEEENQKPGLNNKIKKLFPTAVKTRELNPKSCISSTVPPLQQATEGRKKQGGAEESTHNSEAGLGAMFCPHWLWAHPKGSIFHCQDTTEARAKVFSTVKKVLFWHQQTLWTTWVCYLKLLNISGRLFPHLQSGENNKTYYLTKIKWVNECKTAN